MSETTTFDRSADQFSDYAEQVRGYIRYALVHRNLEPFVNDNTMNVLDFQGGSGIDAVWLANLGHRVDLVDISSDQLARAEVRFETLGGKSKSNINVRQGDLAAVPKPRGSYDLVLCHGVAMYQQDPSVFLGQVASYGKSGSILSILERGFGASRIRLEKLNDDAAIKRLEEEHRFINNMGYDVYAFKPNELQLIIEAFGATVLKWYGVRVAADNDRRLVADLSPNVLRGIIESEYRCSQDRRLKNAGHMLHFIARKT